MDLILPFLNFFKKKEKGKNLRWFGKLSIHSKQYFYRLINKSNNCQLFYRLSFSILTVKVSHDTQTEHTVKIEEEDSNA